MYSILVVDDELSIRESFALILDGKYRLLQAASGEVALKLAADQKIDLAYLDIRMPGMDGLETLKHLKQINPNLEVIMITALNEVEKASRAINLGARDYIVKPFDVDSVLKLTEQILRKKSILNSGLKAQRTMGNKQQQLLGQSEKLKKINNIISQIKDDQRVLIVGEAGTEKELVARLIHENSNRADNNFFTYHLSDNIPTPKIKNVLFGRGQGTSTVDIKTETGLLELSAQGSLFLENLEALPEEVAKTIISQKFSRVGSEGAEMPLQARLIGGAKPGLAGAKKDIFNFFSTVLIELPPLRDRRSDIPFIANELIKKYNKIYGNNISINSAAADALTSYVWPGNLFELEALIERLVLICQTDEIKTKDLPFDILLKSSAKGSDFASSFEKEYIRSIYELSGKNKEIAAARLGINHLLLETKL